MKHTHELIVEETSAYNVVLDLAGLIPGLGEFADAANVIDYARKGDYLFAALSLISLVPVVGDAVGKGGKLAVWFTKAFPKGSKLAGKHGPKIIKKINEAKDLIKKNKGTIDKVFDEVEKNEKFEDLKPHLSKIKEALNAFVSDDSDAGDNVSETIIRILVREQLQIMKITKRQLRKLIREQLEDEQHGTKQKIMQLFISNADHGISIAQALPAGDMDQQFIDNMIELRDTAIELLEFIRSPEGPARYASDADNNRARVSVLYKQWHKAYLDVTTRSQLFSDDVEESIREFKDLFSDATYRAYDQRQRIGGWKTSAWRSTFDELAEWAGVT